MADPKHWSGYIRRAPAHMKDEVRQSLRIAEWKASMVESHRPQLVEFHYAAKQEIRDEMWQKLRGLGLTQVGARARKDPAQHFELLERETTLPDHDDPAARADMAQRLDRLSEQQLQVLELVSDGYTLAEIAERLGLGTKRAADQIVSRAKEVMAGGDPILTGTTEQLAEDLGITVRQMRRRLPEVRKALGIDVGGGRGYPQSEVARMRRYLGLDRVPVG